MNKEDYRILKELTSLREKRILIQKDLTNELSRIDKIQQQRFQREKDKQHNLHEVEISEHQMTQIELQIRELDQKISKTNADLKSTFDAQEQVKLQHQLDTYLLKRETLEIDGLDILDRISGLSDEIENCNQFLKGSLETIAEIEQDIQIENADLYKDFKNIELRIPNLEEQLPEKLVEKYYTIAKKYTNPLAEITPHNSCTLCRYLIPIAYVNKVEKEMKFTTCPGCGRILIPQSSKYL